MRKLTAGILGLFLSGGITGVVAAPTTRLPPAPPPSAFIHSINAHPVSVHVNQKTQKHRTEKTVKKNTGKKRAPESRREMSQKK